MLAASSERKSSWFARFGSWPRPRSRPASQQRPRRRTPKPGRRTRALSRRRDLWGRTPQKAKPRQAALKKRARQAKQAPAGRQITVHARPSYLTLGTQAPVGTVGNGYVYSTFNQPTPIEGTFQGMRGRERITDPLGNAAPGLTLFRF